MMPEPHERGDGEGQAGKEKRRKQRVVEKEPQPPIKGVREV